MVVAHWNYVPRSTAELRMNIRYPALCLFEAVNDYRLARGLNPVPYSPALSYVALVHSWDVSENLNHKGLQGNLHSWSGRIGSQLVYTDHSQAPKMWVKPKELGTGYHGRAYEVSQVNYVGRTGTAEMLAAKVLQQWLASPAHRDMILNTGSWSTRDFQAMGAGWYVKNGQVNACLWFGHEPDTHI